MLKASRLLLGRSVAPLLLVAAGSEALRRWRLTGPVATTVHTHRALFATRTAVGSSEESTSAPVKLEKKEDREGEHIDAALLKSIDKEICDEELRFDKEPPRFPKGWQIVHEEGSSTFVMHRIWRKGEGGITPSSHVIEPSPKTKGVRLQILNTGKSEGDDETPPSPPPPDTAQEAAPSEGEDSTTAKAAATGEEGNKIGDGRGTAEAQPTTATSSLSTDKGDEKATAELHHRSGGVPQPRYEMHWIRGQLTSRDPSLDPECDVRGEHFPFTLQIRPCTVSGTEIPGELVTEMAMDVVEGEVVVDSIRVFRSCKLLPDGSAEGELHSAMQYPGPSLDEAEEEVLDGIHAWLAQRELDDQFGEFMAHYSAWIEQVEYERWLRELKAFVLA